MSRAVIERALGALRDVTGVHGGFVLSANGVLLGKDLPAVFQDQVFVEVGERLVRLLDAMTAEDDEVSTALLRFAEHHLHVTRFPHGLLVAITDQSVNTAALRMALALTARRLQPEVLTELTNPPPPVGPPSSAAPGSVAGSHGAPRTYRGRTLPG